MSEKFRLYRKIGFQFTFYTKRIKFINDISSPLIILRSIVQKPRFQTRRVFFLSIGSS